MKTAEERFSAWMEAEKNSTNETSEQRVKRLQLHVAVCEDMYEKTKKEDSPILSQIAAVTLSNARLLLSCYERLRF